MSTTITEILNDSNQKQIPSELYAELTKLARSVLNKNKRHDTLDTSAVVHESIIKFYNKKPYVFASRGHFYALMSKIMRELIIDYIRHKSAQIRGNDFEKVTLTGLSIDDEKQDFERTHLLDVDNAINKLAYFDEELEQILIMKFYGGLKLSELADIFRTSESSIKRELRTARAFVKSQLPDYSDV